MTQVSTVNIKKIPQLTEVLELPANADIPIYDPATGITGRIKAALLKGGEEIKTNWSSTTTYAIEVVVEFQLKLWKSLINNNIGNTPVEGSNWTEVSRSTGNGYGYWSAGVFTQDPSMVIRSGGLFLLDNTKVTFPFSSTDFEAEYQAGIWVQLTGSGGGGFVWDIQHINSATVTQFNAVKNTLYLIDCTTAPVLALLPDAVAENVDDFAFVLYKDTHKFTVRTVTGNQIISNDTSQIIPTIGGGLELKCNGTGYDISSDTRQLTSIVTITENRNFGTDGFENNIIYRIHPAGGEIQIQFPPAFQLPGSIVVKSHFEQVGEGRVTFGDGDTLSEVLTGDKQGFDIVWAGTEYSISGDTRPKQLTASIASYPVSENSTINDTVTGTFFKQRVTTIEDARFDKINAVETGVTITLETFAVFQSSISDAGIILGVVSEGLINIIYNARRTGINVYVYFKYFKRTGAGVETEIATSSTVLVNSDVTTQYIASATHSEFTMSETDRLIVRGYARKSTTGVNPTLFSTVEGATPTKSILEVSAGSVAHNTLAGRNLAGAHNAIAINYADGKTVESDSIRKLDPATVNKIWYSNSEGKQSATTYNQETVLNTDDIDVSDPTWMESEERLLLVKKVSGSPAFEGAAALVDIFAPPGVESTLRDNSGWTNDVKTITGDNSTYALGQKGQVIWLNDHVYCQCTSATYAVSGSATYTRNRNIDVLDVVSSTQDAAIVNKLDPSYTYPAMTVTGNSSDLGWDLTTQTKVITSLPVKLGSWFVGGISGAGYEYHCFAVNGTTSYWKRRGTPDSYQRPIYAATHPTLTSHLLAHDFVASAYVPQLGDETTYVDQTFYDETTRAYFIKMINGNWEKK